MRLFGYVLLIVGFLLCVSIVWAALGFLMMGFGLICLLIAERNRKRAPKPDKSVAQQSPAVFLEPTFAVGPAASDLARRLARARRGLEPPC